MSTIVTMVDPRRLFEKALFGVAHEFGQVCTVTFDDPLWNWPHTTRRHNGETVSSPRNIVDTGELRGSLQPPEVAGYAVRLTWDSEHAQKVFEGEPGKPARNLPMFVALNFDFPAAFLRHL